MPSRLDVYKCPDCAGLLEVVSGCDCEGELKCCDTALELQTENTRDAAVEKHVPIIEKIDGGYRVKVGSVAHPMEQTHWIMFVELIAGDKVYRQDLHPGQPPEAEFTIDAGEVHAREFCNLHGLWRG